eukprot:12661271-Ditylum_brightwellii.AAC.1
MVSTRSTPFEQQDDQRDDFVCKKPRLMQQLDDSGSGGCPRKVNGCKAREEANDCFFNVLLLATKLPQTASSMLVICRRC